MKAIGDGEALRIARELAATLAAIGAGAVVLLGSHARGDAHRESDIDLYALGEAAGRPEYRLERHGGYLVSLSWRAVEREREAFRSPEEAGGAVPGWRTAVILHDPDGIAAALRREALAWRWDLLDARHCDAHVAEWLTGLAEEVHKLVVSLERGARWTAAVQRSVLALRLARLLALHHRLLYDPENRLWDLVAARQGERWARAQGAALGDAGQPFEESCAAALTLNALAAAEVRPLLDGRQCAVVAHACALAGHPLGDATPSRGPPD